MSNDQDGARFFDRHGERGWAAKVVRRQGAPGALVRLDVTTTDTSLRSFLGSLDRSPLRVQQTGEEGTDYAFAWASGYDNGTTIRIQGVLLSGGWTEGWSSR
jgi:hypothetical protein